MKKISLTLAVIMILGAAGISYSGGIGTTGAQFLKINPSARPMAMGGAFSAVADDSNSVFYNPAGLARIEKRQFSGTYLKYFQGVNYGSLSSVIPKEGSAFGIGVNYLGVTDIEKRTATDADDSDGTATVDTFGAMDTALTIAYAKQNAIPGILEELDLGVNMRFVYQTIDSENAFSLMFDLGAYYPVNDKLSLAFVCQNIGMNIKFKDEADSLPLNIKAGLAYKLKKNLLIACDVNEYIVDQLLYASAGIEYRIKSFLALRAGYKYGYDTGSLGSTVGIAGGVGIGLGGLNLDYSFAPFGNLGDTHRATISTRL